MMSSMSADGGATWSPPAAIASAALAPMPASAPTTGSLPNTNERVSNIPVIDVDRTGGPFDGYLYATFYTWTGQYMKVQLARSVDHGSTWRTFDVAPSSDTHDQWFSWVATNPVDGTVAVTWWDRRDDPSNLRYAPWVAFYKVPHFKFKKQFALSDRLSNPLDDGFGGTFFGDYSTSDWSSVALHLEYCSTLFTNNCQNTWAGVDFGD